MPGKVFDIIHPDKGKDQPIGKELEIELDQKEINELSGEILESKMDESNF